MEGHENIAKILYWNGACFDKPSSIKSIALTLLKLLVYSNRSPLAREGGAYRSRDRWRTSNSSSQKPNGQCPTAGSIGRSTILARNSAPTSPLPGARRASTHRRVLGKDDPPKRPIMLVVRAPQHTSDPRASLQEVPGIEGAAEGPMDSGPGNYQTRQGSL